MKGHPACFSCHNQELWQKAVNPGVHCMFREERLFVGLFATGNFKPHTAMTGSVGLHKRWFKANLVVLVANPFTFIPKLL